MSLSKIIYKQLNPQKVSFSLYDLLNPNSKIRVFVSDFLSGKILATIEKQEFEKSHTIATGINYRIKLLPLLTKAISSDTSNDTIETLFEHRELIHALYNNRDYIQSEIIPILTELELQVRGEERQKGVRHGADTTVMMPGGGQRLLEK